MGRVPGLFPSAAAGPSPSVAAIIAASTNTSRSTDAPRVFAISVWPEITAPGAWPVWIVVVPKPRTHSISRSWAL